MGELYEGIVFRCEEPLARAAFGAVVSPLRLRLVRLSDGAFGVYRVASRGERFNAPAVENVAAQLSARVGKAVALFYDNRCDVEAGVLYASGGRSRGFGEEDGQWVPYSETGELVVDHPKLRVSELQPDREYDCIVSPIDAALQAVGAWPQVTGSTLTQAFCYDECDLLAESGNA